MRLATIAINGQARAAVFADGAYVDVQATDGQLPGSVRQIIAGGAAVLDAVARAVRRPNAVKHPAEQVTLLAPMLDRLCEIVTTIGEDVLTFQRSFVPPLPD